MKKILLISLLLNFIGLLPAFSITIEECVEKAEANYPLIKKYDILSSTLDVDLSDINKNWLPHIGVYAQGTIQNVVPAFPETLTGVLQQMGQDLKGLGKFQYKLGADITQTIWDGGATKAQRAFASMQNDARKAQLDVDLYTIRQRVENLYFALLLTEEQIAQCNLTYRLLESNTEQLKAMLRNGVAMKSDVDMMEAQLLTVKQSITNAEYAADSYRMTLALFTGLLPEDLKLERPQAEVPPSDESARPELSLLNRQILANDASVKLSDTSLMPKIGLFAQAYYGYPGFDYFHSMTSRDLSFNVIAGIKLSWNIDSFYTRQNTHRRATFRNLEIETDRDTFLFNSSMQSSAKREEIAGIRKVMEDDERIVNLRTEVRKAAESQLRNGVIDTNTLLNKITDEEMARLSSTYHEIQLLQKIYQLKYILNK